MKSKFKYMFLAFILSSLLIVDLSAQGTGKINIAVMDLEVLDVSASAKKALSDRLRTELFNTGRFAVMERNKMDDILKEQGFQQSGCTTNECVVEAGRLLGVDRMIAGSIGKVGTIYTVSLRMIDIETSRIMLTKTEDCNCPLEEVLTTSLRNVALKMAGLSPDSEGLPFIPKTTIVGQGDFYFKSTPPGAQVFIDDQPMSGVTPFTMEGVPAGTHQIRMQKEYYSGSQTVFLEPDEFKKVELVLVKAKGSLKIVTDPLEAEIILDNKSMGTSPQTLTGLDTGEHLLKLSKSDHVDYEQVISVEGDKTKRLNITLEKIKPGTLKISSQPPDCDVYVNGQYKGRTPVVVRDVMPGLVQLKIVNPVYNDWQESVVLKNGEEKEISPELTKKKGRLIVESDPVGAEVEIDGIRKGQTQLTLDDMEYGVHALRISKKDYQTKEEKVELVSAESKKIYARLEPAKGLLSVSGNPDGAEIFVAGTKSGKLPLDNYQLNKGTYKIDVKAMGYESYTETVSIAPNEQKTLSVRLLMKSKSKAFTRSLFVPGLGQHYTEKKGKAVLFPMLEAAAMIGAFGFNSKYNNAINSYNVARTNYSTAVSQTDMDAFYNQMETKYDEIRSAKKMRNLSIGAAIGVWLWNVLDAALFGPPNPNTARMGQNDNKKLETFLYSYYGESWIGVTLIF